MTDFKEVRTTAHEAGHEQRTNTFKFTQLIWWLIGILEAMLALRFVFKLIGVNAANTFAALLYKVTDLFVAPFVSLVGTPVAGGSVLEISTIIAMIVYALIAWALARLVYLLFYRPRGPVSISQTTVAEHTPQEPPLTTKQTVTTDRITTQEPSYSDQTTVTEKTESERELDTR